MKKLKQVLAIVCIAFLIGMYVITFIMAIFDSSKTMFMFRGCIACTIFVPAAAYIYICLHRYAMSRSKQKDYYSPGSSAGDSTPSDNGQQEQQ